LLVGEALAGSSVTAEIDISSIDTNQPDRDAHLLGTDFFAADSHPTMTFRSTAISGSDDDYTMEGVLTINGVSNPVSLAVEFTGAETFPMDQKRHAGFVATTIINRDDYGIDFNMPLGMDKLALGQKITVEIDVQFLEPTA
jgi:polyisoprenoid-binding protein YceI